MARTFTPRLKQYRRALGYFAEDKLTIAGLVVLVILSVILGLMQAWPMAVLIDTVLNTMPRHDGLQNLLLAPFPDDKLTQVLGVTFIGMLMKLAQDTLSLARTMLNYRLRYNGTSRTRRQLYAKLQNLGTHYHRTQPQGDAIYRLSNDAYGPFGVLDTFIGTGIAVLTLGGMTAIMLSRSIPLTLFALSITPFLILINRHFGRTIRERTFESKQADTDLTTTIQRALAAMGLIQAFGREHSESSRFSSAVDRSVDSALQMNWQESLYPLAVQSVFAVGGAIVFGYGGYLVYRDQILQNNVHGVTAGDLMVFMAYLGQLWDPLGFIAGFSARIQGWAASCQRVFAVLDCEIKVCDKPDAIALPVQPRLLSLKNIHFSYRNDFPVLRGVSARIQPGQLTAFVGPSGTGKSTLLNLLARFQDPDQGSILLDHHDIRNIQIASVRKHIALVAQDYALFPASIAENIAYGNPNASESQIRRAAQQAGADLFIESLPEGYNTTIAENAQNISGGQRQRIAIARALLTEAPILILDEPTSALDPYQEQQLIRTLEGLRKQRTIVLVTHRLAAAVTCDRIFVMDGGEIIERGTHGELLADGGFYEKMFSAQTAHGEHKSGKPSQMPAISLRQIEEKKL